MKSWIELEKRFRALEDVCRSVRLDVQSRDSVEYFRLAGVQSGPKEQELEALLLLGGKLLDRAENINSSILKDGNPRTRWLRLMKSTDVFRVNHVGTETHLSTGQFLGVITLGSIDHLVAEAGNLCLYLESTHPLRDDRTWVKRVYDDYGKRIIVGTILAIIAAFVAMIFSPG